MVCILLFLLGTTFSDGHTPLDYRNHSSGITSCLPLGLFITLHILLKTHLCPAHKTILKVQFQNLLKMAQNTKKVAP